MWDSAVLPPPFFFIFYILRGFCSQPSVGREPRETDLFSRPKQARGGKRQEQREKPRQWLPLSSRSRDRRWEVPSFLEPPSEDPLARSPTTSSALPAWGVAMTGEVEQSRAEPRLPPLPFAHLGSVCRGGEVRTSVSCVQPGPEPSPRPLGRNSPPGQRPAFLLFPSPFPCLLPRSRARCAPQETGPRPWKRPARTRTHRRQAPRPSSRPGEPRESSPERNK